MTISTKASDPLVVVVGATGHQGGSVVAHLAASDRSYRIRAITRDVTKPAAVALKEKNVELVQESLTVDNLDGIARAFAGADYAFAVTNYWEHVNTAREVAEGKALVDAAKAAKVKLLIWSGLLNYTEKSSGKYTGIEHCDGKAIVTEYARSTGVPFVDVQAGWYAHNFVQLKWFVKQPDSSSYECQTVFPPTVRLPVIDIRDYGLYVRAVIEDDQHVKFPLGSHVTAYGELISVADIAKVFERVTGNKTTLVQGKMDELEASLKAQMPLVPHAVEDIIQSMKALSEFPYVPKPSQQYLSKQPLTWAEFVATQSNWMESN